MPDLASTRPRDADTSASCSKKPNGSNISVTCSISRSWKVAARRSSTKRYHSHNSSPYPTPARTGAPRSRHQPPHRAGADTSSVIGDANRLEQALQNLVANAVRHTPSAADRVSSRHMRRRRHTVDSQSRIPVPHPAGTSGPRLRSLLQDRQLPFRHDCSVRQRPGLSIVQAIVHRHGGGHVSNAPNGGALRNHFPTPSSPPES